MQRFQLNHTHLNYFQFILRSLKILVRYGLSRKKMESKMDKYLEILNPYGIRPTFSIPGEVLNNHSEVARKYFKKGVEFAVHGNRHIDYSSLSYHDSLRDLKEAVRCFKENNIFSSGCRFPYLKYGRECMAALRELPFKWDSSRTILWEVMEGMKFHPKKLRNYENMLNQYQYKCSSGYLSLPRYDDGLLEIPVSLPDDDLLERLGLTGTDVIEEIWMRIFEQSYTRGELFNLQLHPERILIFKDVLVSIVDRVRGLIPGVWVCQVGDIWKWWEEKQGFYVDVSSVGNGVYEVDVKCSPRGTLLIRSNSLKSSQFYSGFSIQNERKFKMKTGKAPIIGIPKDSPFKLIDFLNNEGFIFEMNEDTDKYSLYLNRLKNFSEENEMKALETIHNSKSPLIRFWRWPNECQSALSITGDIDALTLIDYFLGSFRKFQNDE
jgi:peptidoglycan/xylan/chitin deacetylase (PgdA/CDA1 family)